MFNKVLNTLPDWLFKTIEIQKRFTNFNTTINLAIFKTRISADADTDSTDATDLADLADSTDSADLADSADSTDLADLAESTDSAYSADSLGYL